MREIRFLYSYIEREGEIRENIYIFATHLSTLNSLHISNIALVDISRVSGIFPMSSLALLLFINSK